MALSVTEKVAISLILTPPARSLTSSEKKRIEDAAAMNNMTVEQYTSSVKASGGAPTTTPTGGTTTPTTPTPTTPTASTSTALPHTEAGWTFAGLPSTTSQTGYDLEGHALYSVTYSQAQIDDYNAYLDWIKTEEGKVWPVPNSMDDFINNVDKWANTVTSQIDSGEAGIDGGEAGKEWTDDQVREYYNWLSWYSKYGELTDWKPVSIEDFYNNYDQAQGIMAEFQQRQGVSEQERAEAEAYTQQQREYQEYVRQEAFHEPARLSETFSAWMNQQNQLSGAFSEFVENKYPSLRGTFEAGMPIETGAPTREAARSAALQRESQWQAWLPQQVPGLYQEYMAQPMLKRGERPYMYQPTMRTVNW
jgi:hypothetical protein